MIGVPSIERSSCFQRDALRVVALANVSPEAEVPDELLILDPKLLKTLSLALRIRVAQVEDRPDRLGIRPVPRFALKIEVARRSLSDADCGG